MHAGFYFKLIFFSRKCNKCDKVWFRERISNYISVNVINVFIVQTAYNDFRMNKWRVGYYSILVLMI